MAIVIDGGTNGAIGNVTAAGVTEIIVSGAMPEGTEVRVYLSRDLKRPFLAHIFRDPGCKIFAVNSGCSIDVEVSATNASANVDVTAG